MEGAGRTGEMGPPFSDPKSFPWSHFGNLDYSLRCRAFFVFYPLDEARLL